MNSVIEEYKQLLRDRNGDVLVESKHTQIPVSFKTRENREREETVVEMWVGNELVDSIEFSQLNG